MTTEPVELSPDAVDVLARLMDRCGLPETACVLRAQAATIARLTAERDAARAQGREEGLREATHIVNRMMDIWDDRRDPDDDYGRGQVDAAEAIADRLHALARAALDAQEERTARAAIRWANAALSARLAGAERRAEEAEARGHDVLSPDRLAAALTDALDEQAHLTAQGEALDMHRLAQALRTKLMEADDAS